MTTDHKPELVEVSSLKKHPRNYRDHPDDQLDHIVRSIKEHGFYRNVVIARDGTILAGHGVVEASKKIGLTKVPAVRMPLDPDEPRAIKILTGDNEMGHLAVIDDRLLSELLKEVMKLDSLAGTGYDQKMLANLVFNTRPASEIADFNAALEWVGLPSYQNEDGTIIDDCFLVVVFKNKKDRDGFIAEKKINVWDKKSERKWSTVWPWRDKDDLSSVRFEKVKK